MSHHCCTNPFVRSRKSGSRFCCTVNISIPETKKNELRILIVDDDQEVVGSLKYANSQSGNQVFAARDGNQALASVEILRPDLIALDLMMPRRSGFLVMEKLCQTAEAPIPAIVITANEGKCHRDYSMMLGARDYITKPFVMERLLESVE